MDVNLILKCQDTSEVLWLFSTYFIFEIFMTLHRSKCGHLMTINRKTIVNRNTQLLILKPGVLNSSPPPICFICQMIIAYSSISPVKIMFILLWKIE